MRKGRWVLAVGTFFEVLPKTLLGINLAAAGLTVLRIVAVLLAARLAIILANRLIDQLTARHRYHRAVFDERRVQTLAAVAKSAVRYTLDFVAGVTALGLLGIDTASLLLGAGVAGLAVGFGAQNLVRDVLSGFFVLLEDQYAVGDYVNLGGVEGIVEEIGLRTTQVRDFGGELHILPNGTITRVTNFSRGPLRVLFEVNIPYEADTLQAIKVIQDTLDAYRAESEAVVEGPQVLGVSRLGVTGVRVMVWAKAKSMEHWAVERDLKLRIKESLDRAGIDISYPRLLARQPGDGGRAAATKGPDQELDSDDETSGAERQ